MEAAAPVGGPAASAAMSHARREIDRVAVLINSIRMDKRTVRKLLPIITVMSAMSLYIIAHPRSKGAARSAAPARVGRQLSS